MIARRGSMMLAVFVVLAITSMVAAGLMFRVRAEVAAASGGQDGQHAYNAAMSGIRRAIQIVQTAPEDFAGWYDNPDVFLNQLVWDAGSVKWYFTIYAQSLDDPHSLRYGLTDEASKINVNTAAAETLLKLPNMNDELVDCLLDYLDSDSDPRPAGAEQEYYDQLPCPYLIKNGILRTVEELLLIRGFSGPIVYGEDVNRNGLLEANEDDVSATFPPDNGDGLLDTGLANLITTMTLEPNVDSSGRPRISINGGPSALTIEGLPPTLAVYVAAYMGDGNSFVHPSELLDARHTVQNEVSIGPVRLQPGQEVESGITAEHMPLVLDRLTAGARGVPQFGLVNLNTARREVLAALPGVDDRLADAIVSMRGTPDQEGRQTPAWLLTEGVVDAEVFKQIAPHLTTRSYQYHIRCIGYGYPAGRYCILETVIDLSAGQPRLIYVRDITRLGLPAALDPEESQS